MTINIFNEIRTIKFYDKFFNEINYCKKCSTIRITNKELNIGEVIKAKFVPSNREIILQITGITIKRFCDLNHCDAQDENISSVLELENELKSIYKEITPNHIIYIYTFQILFLADYDDNLLYKEFEILDKENKELKTIIGELNSNKALPNCNSHGVTACEL